MARARLISRTLGTSRCFSELARHAGDLGEFAQALYPMLVVYADDFGRGAGDAFTIKHAVWPTSPRSEADFGLALTAMAASKLIHVYEVNGAIFFQIRGFDDHQQGLHRRTRSKFPELPGIVRTIPEGADTSGNPRNLPSEQNRTEQNKNKSTYAQSAKKPPPSQRAPFAPFYAAFPRKVGRVDAEKAWNAAKIPLEQLPDILAALARWCESEQWTTDNGRFIPYPATWIRRKGWQDELASRPPPAEVPSKRLDWWDACAHAPKCGSAFLCAQRRKLDEAREAVSV